jgi:uncharacterized protein involved in exopolysaccharide biosynthesis
LFVPASSQPKGVLMARYVEALFRYRLRFVALLLIPIALGTSVMVLLVGYRATATLKIEDPSSFGATFVPIGWSANLTPAQNLSDSLTQVVKTPAFSQSLANRLSSSGAISSPGELQRTVTSVATNLKFSAAGSHLMTLTYSCHSAAVCVQVVNDSITVLLEQLILTQRNQAEATAAFWSGQLKDAQASLAAAEASLHSYAAANPGATIDANSTDPQVLQLLDGVRQWRAKVVEAQDSLSLAQYLGTTSARLIQVGTTVVETPHLATASFIGDGSSLLPAALVLVAGLAVGAAYLVLLTWVDRTARDPRMLTRRLGVPVVATIPKLASTRGV